MAITKNRGRQSPIDAYVDFTFADILAAGGYAAIDLPVGAQPVGGDLVVDTAWATSTTATLSVGDASSATRYATTVDLKTPGRTALTLTGRRTTASEPSVVVTFALTGSAPTAGAARLRVAYIVNKRAAFAQG